MADAAAAKPAYLEALGSVERLHRLLLDVLKAELDRLGRTDVNNVQCLLLYNIGDGEISMGELTNRGYYLGSNVSYNARKLTENGYLLQERSRHDRRSVRVRLSDKGQALRREIDALFDRHAAALPSDGGIDEATLAQLNGTLTRLERFWSAGLRPRP